MRAFATLALCLLALPGKGATDDLDSRLTRLGVAIDGAQEHSSMPGLVVGITDRHALRKVIVHGYADLKSRKPLTAESRFAIGSISKAFTSIALMRAFEENRFDPQAPITRYLPSLVIHSRFAPITGHDLLTHTSGLPDYLPDSASSRYAAIELKDFEPSYAPGAHWWYSNTGYQLLGYVLENIEHDTYAKILRRRVLEPIGMTSTSAIIDDSERDRMVVSYMRWPYDGGFVEAPWFEYSAGDGSIVSTVADMSAYVRFILNRGAADRVRVLSERSFAALTTPVLEDYAYGLWVKKKDGRTIIGHSGSIGGFHASVEAHMEDGFGLVFLCNASIDQDLKTWIEGAVTAAFQGKAIPPPPAASAASALPDLHDYVGQFSRADSGTPNASAAILTVSFLKDHLVLETEHGNLPLERMGADLFRATGDSAGVFPFVFGRSGEDEKGKVTDVSQGTHWYTVKGFPDAIHAAPPVDYAAYVGHFVNNGPEGPIARVYVRNGRLMMVLSEDDDPTPQPLEPVGPGYFRIGKEDYSPERARFDTLIDGRALRLFVSGVPLYRKDIP